MKTKNETKPTLTAEQLGAAELVPAYRHPVSARTAMIHNGGDAYTITGLHCGKAVAVKTGGTAAADKPNPSEPIKAS